MNWFCFTRLYIEAKPVYRVIPCTCWHQTRLFSDFTWYYIKYYHAIIISSAVILLVNRLLVNHMIRYGSGHSCKYAVSLSQSHVFWMSTSKHPCPVRSCFELAAQALTIKYYSTQKQARYNIASRQMFLLKCCYLSDGSQTLIEL